jgi:hypothetical protein
MDAYARSLGLHLLHRRPLRILEATDRQYCTAVVTFEFKVVSASAVGQLLPTTRAPQRNILSFFAEFARLPDHEVIYSQFSSPPVHEEWMLMRVRRLKKKGMLPIA